MMLLPASSTLDGTRVSTGAQKLRAKEEQSEAWSDENLQR
jgi:hypothetical protein